MRSITHSFIYIPIPSIITCFDHSFFYKSTSSNSQNTKKSHWIILSSMMHSITHHCCIHTCENVKHNSSRKAHTRTHTHIWFLQYSFSSQCLKHRGNHKLTGVFPTATPYLLAAFTSTLLYPTAMLLKALPPALLKAENSVSPQSSVNWPTKMQAKPQQPISSKAKIHTKKEKKRRNSISDYFLTCPITPSHLSPIRAMISSTDKIVFFWVHIWTPKTAQIFIKFTQLTQKYTNNYEKNYFNSTILLD